MDDYYFVPSFLYDKFYKRTPKMPSRLVEINNDILMQILPYLDEKDLHTLCKSDKKLNEKLCKDLNSQLWVDLFRRHLSRDIPIHYSVYSYASHYAGNSSTQVAPSFFGYKKWFENMADDKERLMNASLYRFDRVIENILDENPSLINIKDPLGNTLLINATRSIAGRGTTMYTLNALLERNADVNISNDAKQTPLMISVQNNEFKPILLDYGANINQQDNQGDTALHYAIRLNVIPLIQDLLSHGANINIRNNSGDNALKFALRFNKLLAVETLLSHLNLI